MAPRSVGRPGSARAAGPGPGATGGLPLATLAVMFGVVFAANGGRYGPVGIIGGCLLAGAGIAGTVRLFRAGRPGPDR